MKQEFSTIKIIVSDLDGTLLNSNHKISDYTKNIFQELYNQNYVIIVATGRHHLDAMFITKDLGFPIYLVTSNGARIHSPNQKLLYAFDMNPSIVQSLLKLDVDPEITTVLFQEQYWLTSKKNEKLNSFQKEMVYPYKIVDFKKLKDYQAIKIFFTHEDHNKLVELKNEIVQKYSNSLHAVFSLPFCLELMDKAVDKRNAIAKILELEGCSFENTIAFGDGFNDEKMLLAAKKGYIMKNAPESLKSSLSELEVIESNTEDGVAQFIENNILKMDSILKK